MLNLIKSLSLIALLFCGACGEYEVQYEGPYDGDAQGKQERPPEMAFIANGNLYVASNVVLDHRAIKESGNIEKVSINDSHTMLAYKATGADIALYDLIDDKEAGSVAGTAAVDWFDWQANNETLYYLEDGIVSTYGPTIPLAITDLNTIGWQGGFGKYIPSVAVAADGTVIWAYRLNAVSTTFKSLYFYYPDRPLKEFEFTPFYYMYERIRINADQDRVWVATEEDPYDMIDIYEVATGERLSRLEDAVIGSPGASNGSLSVYARGKNLYLNNSLVILELGTITDIDN